MVAIVTDQPRADLRAGVSHFRARLHSCAGLFAFSGGMMERADLRVIPKDADEAATRYAVLVHFAQEKVPTLDELSKWSGLAPDVALRALRGWHPILADLIETEAR